MPKIDFDIRSNLYHLKVEDYSDWGTIENQPSIIEITLPGYSSVKTHYFDKHAINVFHSINLISSCTDCSDEEKIPLPDGIYVIKVIGSPSTYNKELKYLKTDSLQMKIDKIYIDTVNSKNRESLKNKLTEIEFMLNSAEAHLRWDNETEARMLYDQIVREVEKLTDCKTCG